MNMSVQTQGAELLFVMANEAKILLQHDRMTPLKGQVRNRFYSNQGRLVHSAVKFSLHLSS